jgi:hypothetical protein
MEVSGNWNNPNFDIVINVPNRNRSTRTGTTTSVVEEFSETRADRVVSTNIAQTIRPRRVTVSGENFKPNTRYYTFFDGIDVNSHCTPTAAAYGIGGASSKGTGLRSDNLGVVSAYFDIPSTAELNFSTGNKTLRITESTTNASGVLSFGEATYSANGEIRTVQEEIISTRNGKIITEDLSEERFQAAEPREPQRTRWVDPLAQSFLVDMRNGIFVTSIEIYVGAKDTALPITVQIRHMENGYPTQKILPFGEVTLSPSAVNVSSDASSSTKFTFPSPVYLESGREYCAVVMTNSNVYTCWVSEMGQKDVQSNDFIDQQPYAGSLFKSQNNSTWTPDQMRDLKMKINRAKFTTGTQGLVQFDNDSVTAENLQVNPIEVITGTKTFRVLHHSHGNYDQLKSNVTIAGVEGDRLSSVLSFSDVTVTLASGSITNGTYSLIQSATSGSGTGFAADITFASGATTAVTITNPGQGYAVANTITFTDSNSQTNSLVLTIATVGDTLGGIPVALINTTHTAGTGLASATDGTARILADIDEYIIRIPNASWTPVYNATIGSNNAIESVVGGGGSATATYNIYYDTLHTIIPLIELPNTTITGTFLGTSATQASYVAQPTPSYTKETTTTNVILNDNNYLRTPQIVASSINETSEMGGTKSFNLTTYLDSSQNNVSPVIDVDSIGILGIQNRINKVDSASDVQANSWIQPTEARGDNNAAIYMTKKVQLKNPANSIHVLFDGYRAPHGTTDPTIDVYYKVLGPDANLQFTDMGWVLATIKETVQPDATSFKEHLYEIEGLEDFTVFSVKIVLQSIDSSNCPLLSNFRAIALST